MSFDHDDIPSNPSGNRPFAEVLEANVARRSVLGGAMGAAAIGFFAGAPAATALAGTTTAEVTGPTTRPRNRRPLIGFDAIPVSTDDDIHVPEGYVAEVIIPWGTPLFSDGPKWKKNASNTSREQAVQVGYNHDGQHFFPFDTRGRMKSRGGRHDNNGAGLLVLNQEYTDPALLTTDGLEEVTLEKVRKHQHAVGVTVIAIKQKRNGSWTHTDSLFNRRVHANTPVVFSGPAANDPRLKAKTSPRGTMANCSMGNTPWGTYVTCEENWADYFGSADKNHKVTDEEKRYGIAPGQTYYRWNEVDDRFDTDKDPNEQYRWGWCVEIDPFDPDHTPVKRTALGRVKHENCHFSTSRGRVIAYTGDDQSGEYIYKFVSSRPWRAARAMGKSPLDEGTLYVAKFNDDGTGEWLPLVFGQGKLTAANGWKDQADVLIRTRRAADAVGATPMDRPEWIKENPKTGDMYVTLTNGSAGPNAANPRKNNVYGHILRWTEKYGDKTGTEFDWDIFVLAGDPTKDPMVNIEGDAFGSPDGLYFDTDGRLWIATDVSNSKQLLKEYENLGNNQMLCADPHTREIRRFLTGPKGAEITGIMGTPDRRTLFVNIQHPGEETKAIGAPTPKNPQAVSSWPHHDKDGRPRPATVVIRRKDGGIVGS